MSTAYNFKCIDCNEVSDFEVINNEHELVEIFKNKWAFIQIFKLCSIGIVSDYSEYNFELCSFLNNHKYCKRMLILDEYGRETQNL